MRESRMTTIERYLLVGILAIVAGGCASKATIDERQAIETTRTELRTHQPAETSPRAETDIVSYTAPSVSYESQLDEAGGPTGGPTDVLAHTEPVSSSFNARIPEVDQAFRLDISPTATFMQQEGAGTGAGAANQAAPAPAAGGDDEAQKAGEALANPLSDIWAMFTEFDLSFSNGDAVRGDDDKVGADMIFQPIMPIPLTENWNIITRPTLPIIFSQAVPEAGGGTDRKGPALGDLTIPLVPANKNGVKLGKGTLMFGVGPTIGIPTGTSNAFTNKQWEAGVASIAVYKTKKITAGVFPQYWWSYADRAGSSDVPSTSRGSFLYFFWYNLPQAWQIGTAPSITYNHQAESDDAWNVPIGMLAAKTIKIGKQIVKFQGGIEYSAIDQDSYGKEVLFRFNIIPVIKSPFSSPLFD